MRLIDADALLDDIIDRICNDCDKRKGIKDGKWRIIYSIGDAPCRACSVDDTKDDIDSAPTIDAVPVSQEQAIKFLQESGWLPEHDKALTENAVPVVRCKDCKYLSECHKFIHYERRTPTKIMLGSVPLEYCSRGKRKEDPT